MNNSLSIKNCEPFTLKHEPLFIDLQVTVIIDHDHGYPHDLGGFLSSPPLPRGDDGQLISDFYSNRGGEGWLSPSTYAEPLLINRCG